MIAISPPAVIERARRSADAERICSPVCTFRLVCGHVEAMAQILSPPPPGDAGALPIQLTGEFPPREPEPVPVGVELLQSVQSLRLCLTWSCAQLRLARVNLSLEYADQRTQVPV